MKGGIWRTRKMACAKGQGLRKKTFEELQGFGLAGRRVLAGQWPEWGW